MMSIKLNVYLFGLILFCFYPIKNLNAQQIDFNKTIMLPKQHYNITELFERLMVDYHINLSYDSELETYTSSLYFPDNVYPLQSVLNEVEAQSKTIHFITLDDNIIAKWKTIQKKYTVSGFIRSASDGEALIGATVYDELASTGVVTNEYGFYSLRTNSGHTQLSISYIGHSNKIIHVQVTKDTIMNIELPASLEIDEVVVNASTHEKLKTVQVSAAKIDLKKTQLLPKLIGESDLMKSIQLLPGVQSGTEGTGGLYVRGGSQGNNLVLLDGAPVYNLNHLWGLFSVFNTEALQNVELYTGGFPAEYGGRLSSVLDIRMKEGNNQKFSGSGSIGLISSKILFEGPIVKDKTSFIVTARRSNLDLIATPFVGEDNFLSGLHFYDANFKINHRFSARNRLFFSVYKSYDEVKLTLDKSFLGDGADESTYTFFLGWGNQTSSLRWNYVPKNNLFLNTTLTYSSYNTDGYGDFKGTINDRYQEKSDKYISDLESLSGSIDVSWYPANRHAVKFGARINSNAYPYLKQKRLEEEGVLFYDLVYLDTVFHATEYHTYFQDEIKLLPGLTSQIGLHAAAYQIPGKIFYSLDPRVSVLYNASSVWSVKAAYTEMTQYDFQMPSIFEGYRTEHGISFSLSPEIWLPCTNLLPPQTSKQVVLGTYFEPDNQYELSIEGFYTKMENVIDERDQAIDEIPEIWEELFQAGKGRSYGAELMLEKNSGKLSGWLAYTLSKTERQYENVNNGQFYPYVFDRPHNLNVVLNYFISERFDIGIIWNYKSGRRLTLPDGQYISTFNFNTTEADSDHNDLYALSEINAYQLPAYHRLDVGFNFHKKKKRYTRTLSLGVYNAYKKHNSFLIFMDYRKSKSKVDTNNEVVKSLSLFPLLPYINYAIKF